MLREEYFRRLVDASPIELYLSANDGARIYWPWRMQAPKEATSGYRNACEKYIIDSDPKDESVTTKDVLDTADRLGAEVASLADVYHDKDGTVDELLRGLELYDDHSFNGKLLLPLQEPFVECWKEAGEMTSHWLGIGGLKEAPARKRIQAARDVRQAIGPDVWLHGFGWGVHGGLATQIRDNPNLLDSLDYSSPLQSADYSHSHGPESASVTAMQAATQLITDLRECTEFVEQNPQDKRDQNQSGMEKWIPKQS